MKKNKRILMINNEFPPLGGGQATANFFLCQSAEKVFDGEIDVITASVDDFSSQKFSKNTNIFFLNIGKKGGNLHFQTFFELLKFLAKSFFFARKKILKKEYDKIIAWSGLPAGVSAFFLKKFFRIPYIILLRGADVPFYEARWKNLDRFFFSWISPIIWKNAEQVIANSNGLRKLANEIAPKQKIGILENGVNTNFFTPSQKKSSSKKIKILSVGRLIPRKNFQMILKALSLISKKNDFEVLIAGDGPEKENLQNFAKKNNISLKLLGILSPQNLQREYQNADLFLLPSKNEGMSNALLEALASGLPCIVSNTGGSEELVQDGENGFLLKNFSAKKWAEKIEILQDETLRKKMGIAARKIAEKRDWDVVTKNFFEMIS